jgi:hypothetical protein
MLVAPVAPVSGRKQTFDPALAGPWEPEGGIAPPTDRVAGSGSDGSAGRLIHRLAVGGHLQIHAGDRRADHDRIGAARQSAPGRLR